MKGKIIAEIWRIGGDATIVLGGNDNITTYNFGTANIADIIYMVSAVGQDKTLYTMDQTKVTLSIMTV